MVELTAHKNKEERTVDIDKAEQKPKKYKCVLCGSKHTYTSMVSMRRDRVTAHAGRGSHVRVCTACYHSKFVDCSSCSNITNRDLMVTGKSATRLYCQTCVADGRATKCGVCGFYGVVVGLEVNPDGLSWGGKPSIVRACRDCLQRVCRICGRTVPDTEAIRNGLCLKCTPTLEPLPYNHRVKSARVFLTTTNKPSIAPGYNMDDLPIGVELEADGGNCKAEMLDSFSSALAVKHDGSLSRYGIEIVSPPASLLFHQTSPWWTDVCSALKENGYDNVTGRAGLHIHVDNSTFTSTESVTKLITFLMYNERFVSFIAGREADNSWTQRYSAYPNIVLERSVSDTSLVINGVAVSQTYVFRISDKTTERGIWDGTKRAFADADMAVQVLNQWPRWYGKGEKYRAIRTENQHSPTVEFRLFGATTDFDVLMSRIELTHAMVAWCRTVRLIDMVNNNGSLTAFREYVQSHEDKYKHLVATIREAGI